ncbi:MULTISPECIES: transcriptional regulator [unclassified Serratia (in: enterobacteria)]|uniref:transcriptional regulator n=1 Tax=unclassified Serratia (in: enterobacteria) TaxID=2647522 RepID=UPI003B42ABB5
MNLKQYIKTLKRGDAKKLAEKMEISPSHLSQMAAGLSPISPARAVEIEQLTLGVVTRIDLRPDDWTRIWPELIPPNDNSIPPGA